MHRIDEQLTKAMDRKVWLPSGGTLVIDRTEAMTVVDVNTGKFTGSGGNLEQTVTRNNLEAAEEIVRQLRLRDIGGIVVIDFIDMVLESNRDLVLRRLTEALARDRTRHQVSEVTSLGLVQLTRKKLGTGLIEAFLDDMPALRRSRHPAARRSRRLRRGDRAASRESGGRRGKRGKKGGSPRPRMSRSRRCPRIRPVSIRCSRRWRRPTASHEDDDEDEVDDETSAEEVAEVDSDTIREASPRPPTKTSTTTTDDESDDDDESDEDEIDLDDDDEDDDIDDDIEVIDRRLRRR